MKTIYLPSPGEVDRLSSEGIRRSFLIDDLFESGRMKLFYTGLDRMIVGGVMPEEPLALAPRRELGTSYFTERREVGIINIGDPGMVTAGGRTYNLNRLDCLYIGSGEEQVCFAPAGPGRPAFYLLSCPAHAKHPTRMITPDQAEIHAAGDEEHCSKRRIVRCMHPNGLGSAQLVMGFTQLAEGSIWNTMPPHTHSRRSEVYLYFDLGDEVVVHLMGEPERTRHLFVRDRQAVLSPEWSVHAGAGTRRYTFIWGMAGENQDFGDVDPVPLEALA